MAQESYKINPHLLAYYRDKSGLSQGQVADKAGVSQRQYQRIEKEGCTTYQKAKSIAKVLDCDIDGLTLDQEELESEWLVTRPLGERVLTNSLYSFFEDIKNMAKAGTSLYHNDPTAKLHIDNVSPVCKTITVILNSCPREELRHVWQFYPARFSPEVGVLWRKFTNWRKTFWDRDILGLKLEACYNVFVDGKPTVPPESKIYFCVEFFKSVQKEEGLQHKYEGYQVFENHYLLCFSFAEWFDGDVCLSSLWCSTGQAELQILYMKKSQPGFIGTLRVSRVWVDQQGQRQRAPWLPEHIKRMAESLKKKSRDFKNSWYVPVAVLPFDSNVEHPGQDCLVPPMSPFYELEA